MRTRHAEGRRHGRNVANVGVWGVHRWTTGRVWGYHDTARSQQSGDRFARPAQWGWGYWVTDFWLRW